MNISTAGIAEAESATPRALHARSRWRWQLPNTIETVTKEDQAVGDEDEFRSRPARFYRERLNAIGLRALGSHCWLSPSMVERATALELTL